MLSDMREMPTAIRYEEEKTELVAQQKELMTQLKENRVGRKRLQTKSAELMRAPKKQIISYMEQAGMRTPVAGKKTLTTPGTVATYASSVSTPTISLHQSQQYNLSPPLSGSNSDNDSLSSRERRQQEEDLQIA